MAWPKPAWLSAARALPAWPGRTRRPPKGRITAWTVLVPVVALGAGLLAATSARASHGTDLRSQQTSLADLVRTAETKVASEGARVKQLQTQVAARTNQLAQSDNGIARITNGYQRLLAPAGLTVATGPGLQLTLDDSHQPQTDPALNSNDLVVHQSDMQAAVNALWAGGAEAMSLMGQRLIQTSAVRCVGNTLLLNGAVFSPPYKISAIGPAAGMRAALDLSPNLAQYRKDARSYGLEYNVVDDETITIAGYDTPIALSYAKVG